MKNVIVGLMLVALLSVFTGCIIRNHVPPGQIKKHSAPGQLKKHR